MELARLSLDGLSSPPAELEKLMKKAKSAALKGQLDVPCVEHSSFIPETLHSNLLVMKASKPVIENMTTLFIGSLRTNYTEEWWEIDVKQWSAHFGDQRYLSCQMRPLDALPDAMNSRDAIPKVHKVLAEINQLTPGEKLRVIVLGTGQSAFFFDALAFLLREWKEVDGTPRKDKYLQFVTSGDTGNHDLSNFCQWLCISGVCETVEFYNTMLYHPFGFCSQEYAPRKDK